MQATNSSGSRTLGSHSEEIQSISRALINFK